MLQRPSLLSGLGNLVCTEDLLELAHVYDQLGELKKAASTLRVYNQLKPADADSQRELTQASLKLNERGGVRLAAEHADTLDAKGRP